MATQLRTDPRKHFAPRFLPWLLTAASLATYWYTLNRWVAPYNLQGIANIAGWTWLPQVSGPITFLVTYPFRWLSPERIPFALNVFSAVCGALTLGLLARSVALLPHDRTDAQRKRERSDFSFLTSGSAWLPPLLAVAVCGLQLTFWQNATNYTGETFDLLLFAFVIWSLLEYRLDERPGRLFLASFVFGAGAINNWAMLGFFPLFIAALVWIRGLSFFNLQFLKRMFLCGLLGTLFFLLLPVLAVMADRLPMTFWETLKVSLVPQYNLLKLYFFCCLHPPQHLEFLALLLAYLFPTLVMATRWKAAFGDHSPLAMSLTSFLFHIASATFLVFTVWMAFDPSFSPRHIGFGTPYLTLYYLGALTVGYFCGYFLLIFGKEPHSRMQPPPPEPFQFLNPLVLVSVWVFAAAAITGLIYRNLPQIRMANNDTFEKYASFTVENLPRTGGILLSDDMTRSCLAEAALAREGRLKNFLLLDTRSLNWPPYLRFLHKKYPQKVPQLVAEKEANLQVVNPIGLIGALNMLAKSNVIYYLHPSFGFYFEQFYQEPHGLVYKLKMLPEDTLLPPLPDKNLIAENQAFWARVETQALAPIKRAITPPDPNAPRSWGQRMLERFHVTREDDQNAILAGIFYSRSLNYWGVQLQRAGDLTNAATFFTLAEDINPDNFVARINLEFNQSLRAGKKVPLDLSKTGSDQFGKYRDWSRVLNVNGPFDEPSFCYVEGLSLATQNGFYRQAVTPLMRVRELEPDNLLVRVTLGQIYVMSRLPDCALEVLRDPLEQPDRFSLDKMNDTELNIIAAAAYFQKTNYSRGTRLLETEIARHPGDDDLLTAVVRAYLDHNLYTNALAIIDRKLQTAPDNPNWLFFRGYTCFQMKAYDDAVTTYDHLLRLQANNDNARLFQAVACLNSGRLDEARAGYEKLQQTFTNSYLVAYGLGEIAWRNHQTNEVIRNYKIYLANADTNTAEAATVSQRLRELKGRSP
jgi:tetratricopeptide (TPR) repeat protein